MSLLTSTASALLRPEEVGALLVQPTFLQSIAAQVATIVYTSSHDYRIPVITADPSASWVAEGAEITPSDAVVAEVMVTPKKLAGLSIISTELAEDTNPAAATTVGQGLARDLGRKLDDAFFGSATVNGPAGLGSLTTSTSDTGSAIANLDPFAEALAKSETVGAQITAWVANPLDALNLAKVKRETGSNEPLLGADPTSATSRSILGVPLYVTSSVTAGTLWGIPKDRVFLVVRKDSTIEVSKDAYFSSDRVAVRGIMRVAFGFAHPLAVVKLSDTA